MDLQLLVFITFIVLSLIVALVYAFFYMASSKGVSLKNPDRIRFFLAVVLLAFIIVYLLITLPRSPYFLYIDSTPDRILYVGAKQFNFAISDLPITTEEKLNQSLGNAIAVKNNELVEFRVTSFDVNHGLGIYDPKGRLVAQVQAMPGYINRLRWRFKEPGVYTIQCLEYCGVAHAYMRTNLEVLP